MRIYKVKPGKDCNPHCEDNIESALSAVEEWLKESDIGTVVSIAIIRMTDEEFDALPEYEGP